MAFKLRSGNKPGFKNMGSSPAKDMKTGSYDHSFESPVKQKKDKSNDLKEFLISERGFTPADADKMIADGAYTKKDIEPGFKRKIVKPKKSTESAHGQLDDAQAEYEADMRLYNKSKKDKPVKPKEGDMEKYSDLEKHDDDNPTGKAEPPKKKKSPAKQAKQKGLGPRTAFGGVKNPELTGTKKPFTKKVMKDNGGKDWKNPHAVKSDAQKKVEAKRAEYAKMTDAQKKAAQEKANAKRKAFEATPEYKKRRAAADKKMKQTNKNK